MGCQDERGQLLDGTERLVKSHWQVAGVECHPQYVVSDRLDQAKHFGQGDVRVSLQRDTAPSLTQDWPEAIQDVTCRLELFGPCGIPSESVMAIADIRAHMSAAELGRRIQVGEQASSM